MLIVEGAALHPPEVRLLDRYQRNLGPAIKSQPQDESVRLADRDANAMFFNPAKLGDALTRALSL